MRPKPISALEGDTFVVSDRRGDIDISPEEAQGLFALELTGIPGRRGRADAFARGLIDVPGEPAKDYARETKLAA
jgi:hypothetical protein